MPEHQVRAGALRGDRFGEHPGAEQAARGQDVIEPGQRPGGSVAVDGRDLRGPPGGAVDHRGVLRPGRVGDGPPVQVGPPGRDVRPEGVVETGEVYRPGLLGRAQPEREIEPVRPADLLAQEPADGAPVDPAYQLADQVPIEQRRLPVRGAGRP